MKSKPEKRLSPRAKQLWDTLDKKTKMLEGNFGGHSLRKTFGYFQYTFFKTPIELLQRRFNHDSPRVTLLYIGLSDPEIQTMMMKTI